MPHSCNEDRSGKGTRRSKAIDATKVARQESTTATGINNVGQIVGNDRNGGVVLSDGISTTIDVPGSARTEAFGINDLGQVVGVYYDFPGDYGAHGFLATPVPEPSTLLLLAIGTVGLIGWVWQQNRSWASRRRSDYFSG